MSLKGYDFYLVWLLQDGFLQVFFFSVGGFFAVRLLLRCFFFCICLKVKKKRQLRWLWVDDKKSEVNCGGKSGRKNFGGRAAICHKHFYPSIFLIHWTIWNFWDEGLKILHFNRSIYKQSNTLEWKGYLPKIAMWRDGATSITELVVLEKHQDNHWKLQQSLTNRLKATIGLFWKFR